jgi:hypothetical protein
MLWQVLVKLPYAARGEVVHLETLAALAHAIRQHVRQGFVLRSLELNYCKIDLSSVFFLNSQVFFLFVDILDRHVGKRGISFVLSKPEGNC